MKKSNITNTNPNINLQYANQKTTTGHSFFSAMLEGYRIQQRHAEYCDKSRQDGYKYRDKSRQDGYKYLIEQCNKDIDKCNEIKKDQDIINCKDKQDACNEYKQDYANYLKNDVNFERGELEYDIVDHVNDL